MSKKQKFSEWDLLSQQLLSSSNPGVSVEAIGAYNSPKRWLEMNPGGRRHPKKSWVGRGGRKLVENSRKKKFSEWDSLQRKSLVDFRRVFLAYLEGPNSILIKNPKISRIILKFPYFPYYPCLGSLGLLSCRKVLCPFHHPNITATQHFIRSLLLGGWRRGSPTWQFLCFASCLCACAAGCKVRTRGTRKVP